MRLMWFRRDLRLEDNTAFTAALKAAESYGSNVLVIAKGKIVSSDVVFL